MDHEIQMLWNAAITGKIKDRKRVIEIKIAAIEEGIAEHRSLMLQSEKLIQDGLDRIKQLEAEAASLRS